MTKDRIIGIIFCSILTILLFKFCPRNNRKWKETISLSKDVIIYDTIILKLENDIIFADKNEAIKTLKEIIKEYDSSIYDYTNGISVYKTNSPHLHLLTHLDSLSGNFLLESEGSFRMKMDTISIAHYKINNGIYSINSVDWEKDTLWKVRDYTDERNFFFNSLDRIINEMISKNKVKILDKKSDKEVYKIVLKHYQWGIESYYSHYEFQDGNNIIGKELFLGL